MFISVKIYSVGVWNLGTLGPGKLGLRLKFTPLEFETHNVVEIQTIDYVKIYSVGVWNWKDVPNEQGGRHRLKFTPLEFETLQILYRSRREKQLKFTPLEFETHIIRYPKLL